jgi:hypothetical protein
MHLDAAQAERESYGRRATLHAVFHVHRIQGDLYLFAICTDSFLLSLFPHRFFLHRPHAQSFLKAKYA